MDTTGIYTNLQETSSKKKQECQHFELSTLESYSGIARKSISWIHGGLILVKGSTAVMGMRLKFHCDCSMRRFGQRPWIISCALPKSSVERAVGVNGKCTSAYDKRS